MEGKTVVLLDIMVLALLSSLLAASARDPRTGLPLQGKPLGVPMCCDRCRYDPRTMMYTCEDRTEMEWSCRVGCSDCFCDPMRYPSCVCRDRMYSCPRPCATYPTTSAAELLPRATHI